MPARNSAVTFWSRVDQSRGDDECWPWLGRRGGRDGRGLFDFSNRTIYAHRAAWFFTFGQWPTPQANHTCDNPLCCNPAHLYQGTQRDNIADRERRGRTAIQSGDRNHNARLTQEQVIEIRATYRPGSRGPYGAGYLARRHGVHRHTIQLIGRGQTWVER